MDTELNINARLFLDSISSGIGKDTKRREKILAKSADPKELVPIGDNYVNARGAGIMRLLPNLPFLTKIERETESQPEKRFAETYNLAQNIYLCRFNDKSFYAAGYDIGDLGEGAGYQLIAY
ncbi:MAG: hypothetical protein AABY22_31310 [Nanoarchaeota archaeon]